MSTTQKKLITPVQLSTATAIYYTVPTGTRTTITNLLLHNTSALPVEVTIYLVQSGGSAGAANQAWKLTIPSQNARPLYELVNQTLAAGDTIQLVASTASAVTLHLSGQETV